MDLKKKKTTATDLCIGQIITLLFNDGNHNQIKAWNQIKDSHPYWILDRIGPHWKQMHSSGKDDLKAILWHTQKNGTPLRVWLFCSTFSFFFVFLLRPFKVSAGTAIKDRPMCWSAQWGSLGTEAGWPVKDRRRAWSQSWWLSSSGWFMCLV